MTTGELDLTSRIGRVQIEGFIGNAPGPLKDEKSWRRVAESAAAFITAGSFCAEARAGNSGDVYWTERAPLMALNSLGLPCKAPQEYLEELERLKQFGKPIIVSVAGFKPEDFVRLAEIFGGQGYIIEGNFTCPNVEGHGVFAYDLPAFRSAVVGMRRVLGSDVFIIRLNPHPDSAYHKDVARIASSEGADGLALCNTVPNCLVLNPDTLWPVITPNKGLAGYSGEAINPIVMGQVFQYRDIGYEGTIIFDGGITTGQGAVHALAVGADAVRSATDYSLSGADGLQRKIEQLIEEMQRLGVSSLDDIRKKAAA